MKKARSIGLFSVDYVGGNFIIFNFGMFGVD